MPGAPTIRVLVDADGGSVVRRLRIQLARDPEHFNPRGLCVSTRCEKLRANSTNAARDITFVRSYKFKRPGYGMGTPLMESRLSFGVINLLSKIGFKIWNSIILVGARRVFIMTPNVRSGS